MAILDDFEIEWTSKPLPKPDPEQSRDLPTPYEFHIGLLRELSRYCDRCGFYGLRPACFVNRCPVCDLET